MFDLGGSRAGQLPLGLITRQNSRPTLFEGPIRPTSLGVASRDATWTRSGRSYHLEVRRILITGMSGAGKSSVINALAARGFKAIDTDWDTEWEQATGDEWIWREDKIRQLLDEKDDDLLFIGACVSNQGKFYDHFDHVILLTAQETLTIDRLASRENNPYGKRPAEIDEVLRNKATIEPLLRRSATAEIDASDPLGVVVAKVLEIAQRGALTGQPFSTFISARQTSEQRGGPGPHTYKEDAREAGFSRPRRTALRPLATGLSV